MVTSIELALTVSLNDKISNPKPSISRENESSSGLTMSLVKLVTCSGVAVGNSTFQFLIMSRISMSVIDR